MDFFHLNYISFLNSSLIYIQTCECSFKQVIILSFSKTLSFLILHVVFEISLSSFINDKVIYHQTIFFVDQSFFSLTELSYNNRKGKKTSIAK